MAEKKTTDATEHLEESFRETTQVITESIVAAQERNMKFVQSTLTSAMEVMKSHVEATRALMQELEEQARKQQDSFRQLVPQGGDNRGMDLYLSWLRAPFTAYQQALEVAEKATEQGRETFQKAIRDFEKAARRPENGAKK